MKEPLSQVSAFENGRKFSDSPAFALISTLLIIAVLTIMVIAFMQSMRVDRLTARSYLDKYRADLAAQSALNEAVARLRSAVNDTNTGKGDFAYTTELMTDTNTSEAYAPVLTISRYSAVSTNLSARTVSMLVSGTNNATFTFTATNTVDPTNASFAPIRNQLFNDRRTNATADLNFNQQIQSKRSLEFGGNVDTNNYYRVSYSLLTNAAGKVSERYAYLVLDEQAKLNAQFHRGAARDNYATNANEIPLSGGNTNSTNSSLLTLAEQSAYLADTLAPTNSAAALRFVSTNRVDIVRNFYGSYDTVNQDAIPGIYPDGGKPKYNIKDLATNTAYGATDILRAENIATIIDRNLPDFKQRDPSFTEGSSTNNIKYVRRLAANIVDYIDTDTTSTFANSGEPAGKDLFPMVTGVAENFKWTSKGVAPGYICKFETQYSVQIWNPYTYPVTGKVKLQIQGRMILKVGNAVQKKLADYEQTANNVVVRPNEFVVVEFASVPEEDRTSGTDPDDNSATTDRPTWDQTSSSDSLKPPHPYFKFYWNDQLVDMNRRPSPQGAMEEAPSTSGLLKGVLAQGTSNTNRVKVGVNRWSCHFPQSPLSPTDGIRRALDPRINSLSNYDWLEVLNTSYTSGTKWGGLLTTSTDSNMNLNDNFKERDFVRVNPNLGGTPTGITQTPKQVAAANTTAYNPNFDNLNAPFYMSTNSIRSIGELGNVFDPAQASDNGKSYPKTGSAGAFSSGGGRSLRVGRPEFSTNSSFTWDTKGKRAMELLDLFTVNSAPTTATNSYPQFKGRININTAPAEVLQALFYNIQIKSDEGLYKKPDGTDDLTKISAMTEATSRALASAIVKDRAESGSFSKVSDLSRIFILNNPIAPFNPVWNGATSYSPKLGSGADTSAPEVVDRAREELFAKMVNLVDTQSRVFRIYSTGQALGPTGKVMARSYLESLVILEQGTNSSGDSILVPRIVYEKFY